ncbi:MAG: LacI family DNA-binding transcriptional regulator [Streptosporangiaceae bacterium]
MASSAGGSAIRPAASPLARPVARRPVMADVARLAGVSHQTVSRVVNDHPNVRPQTRDNVLAAISKLAYRPNAAARTLVTRRTHTLGVISCDTDLFGPASMLYGIEQAAAGSYFVSIASLPALDHSAARAAVERLLGQGVEGIIVIAPSVSAVAALDDMPAEVPLVAVGCGTSAPLASVAVDNPGGAISATRYLLGLGHHSVHYVAGPQTSLDARERTAGWRQALDSAGVHVPPILTGDWSSRSGYVAARQLAGRPEVTAVFCANDQMALGVLRALAESGRRVPDEVSVVGFDDIPEAGYFGPPLTTVRQNFGELGRRALRLLIDKIAGAGADGPQRPVGTALIVRESTAAARDTARS